MGDLSILERTLVFYGTCFPNHPGKWRLHERLRRWLGVRINRDLEGERAGLKWSLNPGDYSQEDLFWLGTKNLWELHHLRKFLGPGCVLLDVGANFGYYALMIATALGRSCQVHALEPDPGNCDRLRRHIVMNGLESVVQTHQLGVSDQPQTVAMSRHPINSGHTAVVPDGEIKDVQLTTIDAYCEEHRLERVDAIMLDIEGFEERALRGGERTLARFKPLLLVELFPPVMARQGSSPEAVARLLNAQGYRIFCIRRDRLEPLKEMPEGDRQENVFCFHDERLPQAVQAAGGAGAYPPTSS